MHAPRPLVLAALASAFLALGSAPASADQLQLLDRYTADKAKAMLPVNTVFVKWISHNQPPKAEVYVVAEVKVEVTGPLNASPNTKNSQVRVKAEKIATLELKAVGGDIAKWHASIHTPPLLAPGGPAPKLESPPIDLAYVYTASNEFPGLFLNLSRRLRMKAHVIHPGVEVPADVLRRAKDAMERNHWTKLTGSRAGAARRVGGLLGEPAMPVKPAQPGKPAKPVKPVKPAKPAVKPRGR